VSEAGNAGPGGAPQAGVERPTITPSKLDTYFRCGEQYRRRYVLGERVPPGVALVKGSAVHKAVEVNYAQKVESHVDLPLGDLEQAAAAEVDTRVAGEGLMLTPEEEQRGAARVRGEVVDRAVVLTGLYHKQVAPGVQPVMVERTVRIALPGRPYDFNGRLDVVDSTGSVRDTKTSSKRKQQSEVDRSDALTYYYAAYAHEVGSLPRNVVLDVLIDKARPEVQQLTSTRTARDTQVFVNRVNAMLAGVEAQVYPPAPLGHWVCSPRFCGYWWSCPYVNSERSAAAEAAESAGGGA